MKKTKTLAAALLAGIILQQTMTAQTNAGSNDATNLVISNQVYDAMVSNVSRLSTGNDQTITSASNESASVPALSNAPTTSDASNAPAPISESNNTPIAINGSNEPPSDVASNGTVEATGTNPPALDANGQPIVTTGTNSPAALLPIQFQDVPITTAIESLARLAGINYLLDPKIGYGQTDAQGHINTEPTLSIRWENVTAQQALLALLDNYGLQLTEDSKTKIAKISIKDPSAPPPLITRVIQLKYASTSNMLAAVSSVLDLKRSRVIADSRTSQMVIVATEQEQEDVDTLINELDKVTRQVLIETKLVEISSNPSTTKGIDWSGTLQAQHIVFGNGLSSSTTTVTPGTPGTGGFSTGTPPTTSTTISVVNTPQSGGVSLNTADGFLPGTGFLNADGVSAVFSFLNASSDAQVVSTPRVVTLDNEKATISVTRAFPIINVTAASANSAGGSTIDYSNLGTILEVTPRISANDYIWLRVTPTVSSFFATVNKVVGGETFQADEFDNRTIDTQVLIPNANTLVMGGLVKDSPSASYTKVPVLGDIPILGFAFRSENKQLDKDNLLIFITPTIVKDTDFQPAPTQFLNSRPTTLKPVMNPRNFWDSAKPRHDWSNPIPPADDINVPQDTSNSPRPPTTAAQE
jgi:type II secretory pathway component GspD/PulD (secretin)